MCLRKKTQLVETEDCCWLMGLPPSQLPLHLSSFHVLCSLNERTGSALSEVKCEIFHRSVYYPLKGGQNLHSFICHFCMTRLQKKHTAFTLPLLSYLQLLPVGERVVESSSNICQLLGKFLVQILLLQRTLFCLLLHCFQTGGVGGMLILSFLVTLPVLECCNPTEHVLLKAQGLVAQILARLLHDVEP